MGLSIDLKTVIIEIMMLFVVLTPILTEFSKGQNFLIHLTIYTGAKYHILITMQYVGLLAPHILFLELSVVLVYQESGWVGV